MERPDMKPGEGLGDKIQSLDRFVFFWSYARSVRIVIFTKYKVGAGTDLFPDFIPFVGDHEPLQIMFFSQKKAPEQLSPGASSISG
jgi:hypothetical protein